MFNPSTFHKTVETGKRTDDHIRKAERALKRVAFKLLTPLEQSGFAR